MKTLCDLLSAKQREDVVAGAERPSAWVGKDQAVLQAPLAQPMAARQGTPQGAARDDGLSLARENVA